MSRLVRQSLLREQRGYSVIELLTAMGILGIVMSSLVVVMVSASKAEIRMNQQFQAQTEAKIALDRFRREGHSACRVDPAGPTNAITLTFLTSGGCTVSGGRQVSWCTVANGSSRFGLFRAAGPTCDSTGVQVADHVTVANVFNYQTTSQARPKIAVTLPVNLDPSKPTGTFTLDGDVVLRNASRTA